MRSKFLLFVVLTLPSLAVQGQASFQVLHSFGAAPDGAGIWDSVTLDKYGNVFGTTGAGGTYNAGTVFRLAPRPDGRWSETILHNFPSSQDDGGRPIGGVLLDAKGALYGTTASLGAHDGGVVFRLSSNKGRWGEEILYSFCALENCDDGGDPWGNLIMDDKGDLYGTGYVAFELSPGAKGWTESALHDFLGKNGDGLGPQAGPIRDAAGNLYGTTVYGGGSKECGGGCGIAWELSPPAPGSGPQDWTEHILHRFGYGHDGGFPGGGQLALDHEGNLYGTTQSGGPRRAGTVFKLARPQAPGGGWTETILHGFAQDQDGYLPTGGVIFDSAGNLYGTTGVGGAYGQGVVFKLSPQADGTWKYTLLHAFAGPDGAEPVANLTFGLDGKLYGTAATGGAHGGGVVFQLTPSND